MPRRSACVIHALFALFALQLAAIPACSSDPVWSGDIGRADFAVFESDVYPVLMRDCGFANCHGVELRAFQVWGPGRSRLDTRAADIIEQEHGLTYARALSMLYTDGSRPVTESPLLTKPLEISAGGATHGGVDRYGRNVYRTRADSGFQVLWRWAVGSAAATPGTAGATAVAGSAGVTAVAGSAGVTAVAGSAGVTAVAGSAGVSALAGAAAVTGAP